MPRTEPTGRAWRAVSSGAGGRVNEDMVAAFEGEGVADIVVLDGATPVASQDYIDRENGDVAWFVRHFAAAFGEALAIRGSQEKLVRQALDRTRAAFHARTAGAPSRAPCCWP